MKKIEKGEFGYILYKRKTELLKTISMFSISIALFVMGFVSTGTKSNLLTVVAVLGCLPASKLAVNTFMFFIATPCSENLKEKIEDQIGLLDGFYDMFFTSEKQNFHLSHLIVTKNSILGISEREKTNEQEFEKHMKILLNKEQISGITVKLYHDPTKYCQRLKELNQSMVEQGKRDDIVSMLYEVSL